MTPPDDLEDKLEELEEEFDVTPRPVLPIFTYCVGGEYEIDPDTLEVRETPNRDLPDAVVVDSIERGEASGITIYTEEDVRDFRDRLESGIEELGRRGGPDLEFDDVVAYIAAGWRGELPEGEEGVEQHFGEDVSMRDMERLYDLVIGGAV